MNTPKRQRIVINVDRGDLSHAMYGTTRRRRWPQVLGLLAVAVIGILFALMAAAFFWWRHYQTTPTYSLAVIIDAAQRNDMPTLDRLVDFDKTVSDVATQAIEKTTSRFSLGVLPIQNQLDGSAQSITPRLKQDFHQRLAQELKGLSSETRSNPFIVLALTLPAFVKVINEQNTARIAATIRDQPLELTMQRDSGTWKIVGLKDDAFVERVVDELVKGLPATDQLLPAVEPRKSLRKRK